jgi:hypothetical protein
LRKAIAKVVSEAMILSIEDQNTAAILPKMAKLKRELIEPEASALAARYETLRDSPRPKAAKAPLAAVELSLAMAVNPASGVAYVPALAESLRGVETPALRCQRDPSGGKQNPWYLLWKPAPAAR